MDIKFTRGDTYRFKFQRMSKEDDEIIKVEPEEMWFTVKTSTQTESIVLQKTFKDGEITFDEENYYHIVINHDETSLLPYADYCYDIQVKLDNGDIKTIAKGKFILEKEVTFEG